MGVQCESTLQDLTLLRLLCSAEAAAWEKLARALHEEAPIGGLGSAPETVFGTLDVLTVRLARAWG